MVFHLSLHLVYQYNNQAAKLRKKNKKAKSIYVFLQKRFAVPKLCVSLHPTITINESV